MNRPCTCHPGDNPPIPCAGKYALSECKKIRPCRAIKRHGLWHMIGPDGLPICCAFSLENLFYTFTIHTQPAQLATLRSI